MATEMSSYGYAGVKDGSSATSPISERIGQLSVRRLTLGLLMMLTMPIIVVPESTIRVLVPSYPLNHEVLMRLCALITFLYCPFRKKRDVGRSTLAILLYCALIVAISRRLGHSISYPAGMYMRVVTLAMLFDYSFRGEDRELTEAIADALLIICLLNLAETLCYGDLFYDKFGKTFLLGFDNGVIITVLPTLVVNLLVCCMEGRVFCFRSIVSTLGVTATVLVTDSSTSTVGFVAFWLALLLLLLSKGAPYVPLNACKTIVIVPLLVFYWVVLSRIQRYIANLVVNVLHREMTFTGRTTLWDIALSKIAESPVMGYGLDPESQRSLFLGVSAAHSQILDILYQTGIVGFACYALIVLPFFLSNKSWLRSEGHDALCMAVLMSAIFAFLVMMQFESYSSYISFGLILSLFVMFESFSEDASCPSTGGDAR